ncbi:hypothetical protein TCON_0948 [Astathelohania contejeani]|uniref:Uncharacterized protein n=1 Tax=Astathelohania contejeani TaxID=164912 RepID=A0ABQ7I0A2_9MICR|nr:hypothetical protein TCON_0948 [Thelohania contejeani]
MIYFFILAVSLVLSYNLLDGIDNIREKLTNKYFNSGAENAIFSESINPRSIISSNQKTGSGGVRRDWNVSNHENINKTRNLKNKNSTGLYYGSMWDPILYTYKVNRTEKEIIKLIDNYFDYHAPKQIPDINTFGDLSILTVNLYRKVPEKTENEIILKSIITMINNIHPTIFGLQGVSSYLLKIIQRDFTKGTHYGIANFDRSTVDLMTGQHLYLPIIYDINMISVLKSGYFETNAKKNIIYGSWIFIQDTRMAQKYTIINIDLVSTFTDVVSAEIANIISDIIEDKEISNNPVLLIGGIGTTPVNLKELMKSKKLMNLIKMDKNNSGFAASTIINVHGPQRDFILLRDLRNLLEINYARILINTPILSDHKPVHAILSIKKVNK